MPGKAKRGLPPGQGTIEQYFAVQKKKRKLRQDLGEDVDAPEQRPVQYDKRQRQGLQATLFARRFTGKPARGPWAKRMGEVDVRTSVSAWSAVQRDDETGAVQHTHRLGGTHSMEWDSEGRLFICTRDQRTISVADSAQREVMFNADMPHAIGACFWDPASDVCAYAAFAHTPTLWKVDLETCDEAKPSACASMEASGPSGFTAAVARESIVYAACRDGSVYIFDVRSKTPLTGSFSYSGEYVSRKKGGIGAFGSDRRGAAQPSVNTSFGVRSSAPNSVGGRQAACITPQATCVLPMGDYVSCAYLNGRVALHDVRKISRGAVMSCDIKQAPLEDDSGAEMYGIKLHHGGDSFYRVDDMLPSPYALHSVVCLMRPGWLVEVDLLKARCTRICYPDVITDSTAPDWAKNFHRSRMAYVSELGSFAVPSREAVKIVPWDRHHFGKWETCLEERDDATQVFKMIATSKRTWAGVSQVPVPEPLCVSQVPWSRNIMSANSTGLFETPLLPT